MEVTLFNYAGANDLRTLTDESGDPWFVAKDVCDVLEIKTPANAVRYLDDDEKQTVDVPMSTGHRKATIVNESGLYSLILRSRKPEAKAFKKWITSEVLPSIRKHGAYATDEVLDNMLADPANASKVFQALAEEREKLRLAEAKVIQLNDENNDLSRENLDMQPKAALADKVTDNMTKFRLGVVAKEAGVNQAFIRGVLVAEGLMSWDYRDSGNGRNYYATKKAHDDGLCVFINENFKFKRTTKRNYFFTQKGLDYIVNHPVVVDERESMREAA